MGAEDLSQDDQLLFHVSINGSSTGRFDVALDRLHDPDRFSLNAGQQVPVDINVGMQFSFYFGLNLSQELAAEDAFFLRADEIEFTGSVEADEIALESRVGFLETNVQGGSLNLDLAVAGSFRDPITGNVVDLTLADLANRPQSELLQLNAPQHSYAMSFPLESKPDSEGVARFDLGGSVSAQQIGDAFVDSLGDVSFVGDAATDLESFLRIDSGRMISVLGQISDWFGDWEASAFRRDIPMTSGHELQELVDYKPYLRDTLVAPLQDGNALPRFSTVQQFADQISTQLGGTLAELNANYQSHSNQLVFHIDLGNHAFAESEFPLRWNYDTDPLVISDATGSISISATSESLTFDVVLDLSPYEASILGTTLLPNDGILSADARFDVMFHGGTTARIVVPRDLANSSTDDLLADINAALDAATDGVLTADLVDGHLRLQASGTDQTATLVVQATATNPAVTQLGVAEPLNIQAAILLAESNPTPSSRLSADATFEIAVHGQPAISIVVQASDTATNTGPNDLAADLTSAMHAAGVTNVRAELATGKIQLFTTDSVDSPALSFTANSNNPAVTELGFAASQASDPEMALSAASDSLVNRVALDSIFNDVSLLLISDDLNASGRYGFVGMNAVGSLTGSSSLQLVSPVSQPASLADQLRSFGDLSPGWTSQASGVLEFVASVDVQNNLFGLASQQPRMTVEITQLFDEPLATVEFQNAVEIERYSTLQFTDIVAAARQAVDSVTTMLEQPAAVQYIPWTRVSPAGLTRLATTLRDEFDRFSAVEGVETLQAAVAKLSATMRLDANDIKLTSLPGGDLRFNVSYATPAVSAVHALHIDLDVLADAGDVDKLKNVGQLYESKSRSLQMDGQGNATLVFGLDVPEPGTATTYVHDETKIGMGFRVNDSDLDAAVIAGPLALVVVDGSVRVDNGTHLPASVSLTLTTDADKKRTSNEIQATDVIATSTGSASARLPLAHPSPSNPLNPALVVAYPNLLSSGVVSSTPDLAALRQSLNVIADQTAMPGLIRTYFQSLQSAFDASLGDVNQPIVGEALKDVTFLGDLGEQIATALENRFVSHGKTWDDVKQVLQQFASSPTGEGEHSDPNTLWSGWITTGLPTKVFEHPVASGIPGLSTDVNAAARRNWISFVEYRHQSRDGEFNLRSDQGRRSALRFAGLCPGIEPSATCVGTTR